MPSPLAYRHSLCDGLIQLILANYAARTGVCEYLPNATWLMLGSAPQPDSALRLLPEFGGTTSISGKLAEGAPELIVEVCQSSRSFDLGPKLTLYQRANVREYPAVLLEERRIEWRLLGDGGYRLLPGDSEVVKSAIFPGLWIDERALWAADAAGRLWALETGLVSPECGAFLEGIGRH